MFYLVSIFYIVLVIWALKEVMSGDNKKYLIAKTCASFSFLILGIYSYFGSHSELFLSLFPAYICCFLGDVLLGVAHEKRQLFIPGMLIFLCAHFFFILSLLGWKERVFDQHILWIIFSLLVGTATLISSFNHEKMEFGNKRIPVIIYAYTIGMFGGCGLDIIWMHNANEIGYMMLGFGAFFFMISDCILCLKYFKIKKSKWYPPLVTGTYYIALYLLTTFYLYI